MSWQNILKQKYREKYNEVFADVVEVKKIIDFIKSNRSLLTRESNQPFIDGKLTKEVASDILYLLKNGGDSPYSQIADERNGTSVDIHIDDGIFIDFVSPENDYIFSFHSQDYETMMKNPKKVYGFLLDFLKMIDRTPEEIQLDETAMSLNRIEEGGVNWIPKDPESKPTKASPTGYRP